MGLAAASAVIGEEVVDRIENAADDLTAASLRWKRPTKTQSKQQWQFIGGVVKELLEVLDVTPDAADAEIRLRFGTSGLRGLVALDVLPEWPAR